MGTISATATLQFKFLPPFSTGINSKRKEFAPLGTNFSSTVDPSLEGTDIPVKQTDVKVLLRSICLLTKGP